VERKSNVVLLCCAVGTLLSVAGLRAAAPDRASEILDRAEQRFRSISDYECLIDYECRLPDRVENKTYRVWYLQPSLLRVRVLQGSGKGSEVALDEKGQYRGRKGGILKSIVVRLKPTDKRLQGLRGKSVTEFNLGTVYQRCRSRAQSGADMNVAKAAEAPGTKGVVLSFIENGKRVQETYRFDPSTWFLTSCSVLEDGKLVESFDVGQLKVNAGLGTDWFRL
jgi:outer membrane lipoprotein-sorting protein